MYGLLKLGADGSVDLSLTVQTLAELCPDIEVNRLSALVGITFQVAKMVQAGPDHKRMAQHLWLFELAGRLKGGLPERLRADETTGIRLTPLSLLLVDVIEHNGDLPSGKRRIEWSDPNAVMLEFEEIWYKRRFAKGSPYVDEAVAFAEKNPLKLEGNQYYVLVLNIAYYLQNKQPGLPILLPVSAGLASKLHTTPVTLGTAISKAVREGFIEVVDETYDVKAGKARSFRVNLNSVAFKNAPALVQ